MHFHNTTKSLQAFDVMFTRCLAEYKLPYPARHLINIKKNDKICYIQRYFLAWACTPCFLVARWQSPIPTIVVSGRLNAY